ncbi:MAG: Inositol 2-dehydrogenase/D-chiro-inositol 3-dehydrogenase [Gammaproteobacteria bacterium]|nr:Inositol 2-dehydrogenase/D-chiro-inositol 3-dehydrogenase [Gammaproteobacteria bacterium]
MRVLVLGAGMYVTGRDGTGNGTILSALFQYARHSPVSEVTVVARSQGNGPKVAQAAERTATLLRTSLAVAYQPIPGTDLEAETARLCGAERYDCAIVSLPDHLHAPAIRALMREGVPTLVVKPFTSTLRDALEILALQRKTGTYGAVEFHKRFDESNRYAKRALEDGLIGRPLYMSVDYSQRISIPTRVFRDWVARTNIFQYLGVHYVDLAYFLLGYQPSMVSAYGTSGALRAQGIDAFDSIHVMLEWEGGTREERLISQFNTNWIDPECTSAMSDQRFKIVGTAGRLELDQRNRGIELVSASSGIRHVNPYFSEYLPDPDGHPEFQGYGYRSIACFLDDVTSLRNGTVTFEALERNRPTFRQAAVSTAVIDAVNSALASPHEWRRVDGLPA